MLSFQTSAQKTVSICAETHNHYLVYRFGTPTHIELQYPKVLDESSWKKFEYSGYHRGGGKLNAGLDMYSLSFQNNDITYQIFQTYSAEDETSSLGVTISMTGKKDTTIQALKKTQKGMLSNLDDLSEFIKNSWNN